MRSTISALHVEGRLGVLLRVPIGSIFLLSGIGKMLDLSSFASTIARILPLGPAWSWLGASGIIAVEMLVGSLLLAGVGRRVAASTGVLLILLFLAVLGSALATGRAFVCNCFGLLGPQLPTGVEFGLDLMLLAGLVGHGAMVWNSATPATSGMGKWVVSLVMVVSAVALVLAYRTEQGGMESREFAGLLDQIETERPAFGRESSGNRLLILTDIRLLGCSLCLDDLLSLCDSLSAPARSSLVNKTVLVLRRVRSGTSPGDPLLERWARDSGIQSPSVIVDQDLYDRLTDGKSLAAVVNRVGSIALALEIPMGGDSRRRILALLEEE
jgi:uncharacterized membrane protein YphA (DoxX/SURF4 family)